MKKYFAPRIYNPLVAIWNLTNAIKWSHLYESNSKEEIQTAIEILDKWVRPSSLKKLFY